FWVRWQKPKRNWTKTKMTKTPLNDKQKEVLELGRLFTADELAWHMAENPHVTAEDFQHELKRRAWFEAAGEDLPPFPENTNEPTSEAERRLRRFEEYGE